MGILKDIWKTIFCKTKKQVQVDNPIIQTEKELVVEQKIEKLSDESIKAFQEKVNNKKVRGYKNITKEQEVLKHLLEYGSIDKLTALQNFGLKRLDNYICDLRKQGMCIVNETIFLHNENGKRIKVNNYRLIKENGTN